MAVMGIAIPMAAETPSRNAEQAGVAPPLAAL